MEMQAADTAKIMTLQLIKGYTESGIRRTGIVKFNRNLRILWVNPQAAAYGPAACLYLFFMTLPLVNGIKADMVNQRQQFSNVIFAIGRSVNMDLAAEFLPSQSGLMRGTGAGALQIAADQGECAEHGKTF